MPSSPKTHKEQQKQGRGAQPPRFRPALRKALHLIATRGTNQRDAADQSGMHEKALSRALKRPQVALALEDMKAQAILAADTKKRIAKIVAIDVGMELMQNAQSEQVRARMVEFFAGEPKSGALVTINQDMRTLPPSVGYAYALPRATDAQSDAIEHQNLTQQGAHGLSCVMGPTQEPEEAQLVPDPEPSDRTREQP